MRRITPQIQERPSRKKIIGYLGIILTFCYVTQFGFVFPPKARMGHGLFDHERPQAVQDIMDKARDEKLGIEKNNDVKIE